MTIPESVIPFINIALIIFLILALFTGYRTGLVWQLLKLLGFLAVILLAWMLCSPLAELIKIFPAAWSPFTNTILQDVMYAKLNQISWFIILLVVGWLLLLIIKPLSKVITELPLIKSVNHILGAVFALIPYAICVIILCYVIQTPLFTNGQKVVDSTLFHYADTAVSYGKNIIGNAFAENEAVQKLLYDQNNLTQDDLKAIVSWLTSNNLNSMQIREFLQGLGIDVNDINNALGN